MKKTAFIVAGLALFICVLVPVLRFLGVVEDGNFKAYYIISTLVYFTAATFWSVHKEDAKA